MAAKPEYKELKRRIKELEKEVDRLKSLENEFRLKEARYEKAEEIYDFGYWERDFATDKAVWSKNAYQVLGVNPDSFKPSFENLLSIVHPDDRLFLNKSVKEAISQGQTLNVVYRIIHPDKNVRFIHAVAAAIDSKGQTKRYIGTLHDITGQKLAEETLHKNEVRFSTIFDFSPVGITISRVKDHQLIDVNNEWQKITGFTKEEAIGRSQIELNLWVNPDERSHFISRLSKGRTVDAFEIQARHKSGGAIDLLMSSKFIDIEGERFLLTLVLDITERKRVESELIKFKTICDKAGYGLTIVDLEGNVSYVNTAYAKMHGYKTDELIGKHLSIFHPQQQMVYINRLIEQLNREGSYVGEEVRHKRKDNTDFITLMNGTIIKDEKGIPLFMAATTIDITERKQMEDSLRESEERFREVFEGGPIGIVLTNRYGKFISANPAFCKMIGYTAEEIISHTILDVTHPEYCEVNRENAEKMWRSEIPYYKTKKQYIAKNGVARWGNLSSTIIRGRNGEPLYALGMVEDITDQMNAEKEKEHLQLELFQAQKMETLGTLVSGVAHEINNPINIIMNNISLLDGVWKDILPILEKHNKENPLVRYRGLTYKFLQDNMARLISDIDQSTDRIASIVKGLKDFSKKTNPLEKHFVDINTAVESALQLAGSTIRGSGIKTEINLKKNIPEIKANLQNLEQIILSLLINAVQAIEHEHGYMKVTTDYKDDVGIVVVSIEDNGKGIDPSISDRIYDPFFTERQDIGSIGLGLAITKNLVKINDGEISFRSQKGKGTCFFISFPTRPKVEPAKILIVDDDEGMLKAIKKVLSLKRSYLIEQASDGNEALIKIGTSIPDLLILDVLMPKMDAVGVIKTIKKQKKLYKMKILVVTGYPESEQLKKIKEMGILKVLTKPLSIKELLEDVEEALKKR